jgi:hypothetical protein
MQNSCYEESVKDSPVMMIFLALLAVAGTLGGVWLGRYLERDNEALKWRREHALEAFTEVLRACAVVMDEADNIYHLEPSAERVAQGKLLFEKVAEMYRLSDRVTLLGPREIHASVDALTRYYGTDIAARAQKAPKPSDDEWRAVRAGAAPLYMKFMMQARNDLGVHEPLYSIDELVNRLSKK